jgi:hypothetical protein
MKFTSMTCLQRFNSENGRQEQARAQEQEQEQDNAMMAPAGFPNQEPLLLPFLTSLPGFQQAPAPQHRPSLAEQRETLTTIIDFVLDLVEEEDFLDQFKSQ